VYECINLFVFFLLIICDTLRLSTTPYSEGNQNHCPLSRQMGKMFPQHVSLVDLAGLIKPDFA